MAKLPTKYIRTTSTGKIPLADQAFIFSTMVDLLKMGISLRKSVDFIRIMRPSIAKPMQNVIEQLQRGQSFSAAFQPYVSTNIYYQLAIADQHECSNFHQSGTATKKTTVSDPISVIFAIVFRTHDGGNADLHHARISRLESGN